MYPSLAVSQDLPDHPVRGRPDPGRCPGRHRRRHGRPPPQGPPTMLLEGRVLGEKLHTHCSMATVLLMPSTLYCKNASGLARDWLEP